MAWLWANKLVALVLACFVVAEAAGVAVVVVIAVGMVRKVS